MKLMTLNTHSLSECDEKNKLQTIANFILNHDVDVICLQEVNQSMNAKVFLPTDLMSVEILLKKTIMHLD